MTTSFASGKPPETPAAATTATSDGLGAQSDVLTRTRTRPFRGYRRTPRPASDWREAHAIDDDILRAARQAADAVAERFRRHHRRSHKLNVMLTVNLDDIAARLHCSPEKAFGLVMQLLRNLFRNRQHRFAGFWRREIGTRRYGGNHCHILFHAPRGMGQRLVQALGRLTRDPARPIQQSGSRRVRRLATRGTGGSWHLRRITNLHGLLAYVSKTPLKSDGTGMTRDERMRGCGGRFKEFRTFGLNRRRS